MHARPPVSRAATLVLLPLLAALAPPPAPLAAQVSARLSAEAGRIVPVGGFIEGNNLENRRLRESTALRLEIGWRWSDSALGDPEYGVAIGRWDFDGSEELGTPLSAEGFVRLPLARRGPHTITFDAALGAAWGWSAFDPVDNPKQVVIGSELTATFGLGASWAVRRGPLEAGVGAAYRHFSNGNLRQPNVGLNTGMISLFAGWRPERGAGAGAAGVRNSRMEGRAAPEAGSGAESGTDGPGRGRSGRASGWHTEWLPFVGARGIAADNRHLEQDAVYERQLLPVAGVHARVRRPLTRLWHLALGAGLTWDGSGFRDHQVPALKERRLDPAAAFSLGVGASVMLDTGPAELEFGVGYALFDLGGDRGTSRLFQRLGVHLLPAKRVSPTVVLRALEFDRPNYIEWGVRVR